MTTSDRAAPATSNSYQPLANALADRYRIERALGQGGMATVYLGHDIKHDRKVAVKVLKPELAAVLGAERFVVEIKTTAALQHPHILPLFDSGSVSSHPEPLTRHPERSEGSAGSFLYYVMPFIDGETLRSKLNRETQLGIDEAVRITTQVADALDYAHRHGVIHRDIKPENILLHDGRPMVADFGIALAVSAAAGGRMTETGLSLGTPHYMSPEQATADKDITARSDIYSLASVLYEMLTGNPPHTGASAQQIIMKIIAEPAQAVTKFRKSVPPNVAAATSKALEKLPADRFESAKAFADALGNASFSTTSASVRPSDASHAGVSMRVFGATAVVAALAIAGFAWALLQPNDAPEAPVLRVPIDLPQNERLWMATTSTIRISPQGDRVAYVAVGNAGANMIVRRTSDLAARQVTANVANQPTFSPDGRWLAYADGSQISKVSVDGGPSVPLASQPGLIVRGLWWTEADTILVGSERGLFAVASTGGRLRRFANVDSTRGAHSPVMMPDGRTVAFSTSGLEVASRRLSVTSPASGRTTVFDVAGATVLGLREGHLLYVTITGELNAVPIDLQRQRLTGDPVQLETGIRLSPTGSALASLSANGSLWYVGGQATGRLMRVRTDGSESTVFSEERAFRGPRFSPDGRKIAVEVSAAGGSNIWVYDLASGTFTPVTTEASYMNATAEWSADGRRVTFRSTRDGKQGIWWQPADGSGVAELLYAPDHPINEAVMSPDGKWLLYRTSPGPQMRDIFAVPLVGEQKRILLVSGPAQESHGRVSPDGKWLAYQSNESGRFEVYVRPFPGAGPRVPVSNQGGAEPVWAKSGNTIFYRTPTGGLEAASVTGGAAFVVGQRRAVLPTVDYLNDVSHTGFDVWPDGSGFLMVKPSGGESRPILVHNWGREVREKLAGGKQ